MKLSTLLALLLFLGAAACAVLPRLSSAGAEPAAPGAAAGGSVVVELFTSEGCSSCPPADDLLTDLAKLGAAAGAGVLPLAFHVDYWNRLGWVDPFSNKTWTQRQQDYATALRSDQLYTPQMIVDGAGEFVGSDARKAKAAIAAAAKSPKAVVKLSRAPAGSKAAGATVSLDVAVSGLSAWKGDGQAVEVMLAVAEDGLQTLVPRGENAGRTLKHSGVVRELRALGRAEPATSDAFQTTAILNVPNDGNRHRRTVVFVQQAQSRRIIGAAAIPLENLKN